MSNPAPIAWTKTRNGHEATINGVTVWKYTDFRQGRRTTKYTCNGAEGGYVTKVADLHKLVARRGRK